MDENNEVPQFSPPPQVAEQTLNFSQAMEEVIKGNLIKRQSWQNEEYGLLADGWLSLKKADGIHGWLVNSGDLEGVDWVVIRAN